MSQQTIVECDLADDKYLTSVKCEKHLFNVDEPIEYGGIDSAPKPTEYLLGALGSCTAITIKMYAQRKGWTLGEIHVSVNLKEDINSKEKTIIKSISFQNKLSDEQIDRLLKIGEKCPVSKMLAHPIKMQLINKKN